MRTLTRAAVLAALALASVTPSAAGSTWIRTWNAAPFSPGPVASQLPGASDAQGLTIRNVVRTSVGGKAVRLSLSNTFGTRPLRLDRVAVGSRRARFGGSTSVTIPVGREVKSDPIRMAVGRTQVLDVSVHSSQPTGAVTVGGAGIHTTFLTGPNGYAATTPRWYFLTGVDVLASSATRGTVVVLGASIASGTGSTTDTWRGWVDRVAARESRRSRPLAFVASAIAGNTLHESTPCNGQKGTQRLARDAFDVTGVRAVVVALGVNDLQEPNGSGDCNAKTPISADAMIRLYKQVARRAHAHGLAIYAANLTPFGGLGTWSPQLETERRAINDWMARTTVFDGVIDQAGALADPADPSRIAKQYDFGDGLHPNDAGHAAIARAVPTTLFDELSAPAPAPG